MMLEVSELISPSRVCMDFSVAGNTHPDAGFVISPPIDMVLHSVVAHFQATLALP